MFSQRHLDHVPDGRASCIEVLACPVRTSWRDVELQFQTSKHTTPLSVDPTSAKLNSNPRVHRDAYLLIVLIAPSGGVLHAATATTIYLL